MFGKHHASGGQGGLVYTRDANLYQTARWVADRGKPFGLEGTNGNVRASLNFNMDEIHAAIGNANLAKLPDFVRRRREIAARITEVLAEQSKTMRILTGRHDDKPSYWFLVIKLDTEAVVVGKKEFADALSAEGLPVFGGYAFYPMRMDWAAKRCVACGATKPCKRDRCPMSLRQVPDLPNALQADEMYFRVTIHEGWTEDDINKCISGLLKVENAYLR